MEERKKKRESEKSLRESLQFEKKVETPPDPLFSQLEQCMQFMVALFFQPDFWTNGGKQQS